MRVLLLLCLMFPSAAFACGQTTHVWVSLAAIDYAGEGLVAEIVADDALRNILINGTMFPDGGYAVSDNYGEMAHWEPFQQAYLAWIREEFAGDFSSREAKEHVAFLLGLASHGLSDEIFDSLFFERSRAYDPGHDEAVTNLDTATDVTFAADVGGIPQPTSWAPFDVLAAVYRDRLGYEVDVATLEAGHGYLYTALAFTEWARTSEERLETFTDEFPWAAEHMNDPSMAGSPPRQAPVVADYWDEILERLYESPGWDRPVLAMEPPDGAVAHPTDHTTVEARIHLTFGRGADAASFDRIFVVDEAGDEAVVDAGHFYGDMSHTVLLRPQSDWAPDTLYTVRVEAGVGNIDGDASAEAFEGTFFTGVPVESPEDPLGDPPEEVGCGCANGSASAILPLLLWRRRRC